MLSFYENYIIDFTAAYMDIYFVSAYFRKLAEQHYYMIV